MPGRFKVDLPALHTASAGVHDENNTLSASHGQVIAGMTSAQSGWIGTSSQALSDLTGRWERITRSQTETIGAHADGMSVAAQLFGYQEERHAKMLRAVYGDRSSSDE